MGSYLAVRRKTATPPNLNLCQIFPAIRYYTQVSHSLWVLVPVFPLYNLIVTSAANVLV